jgi:hypothetical protein
MQTLGATVRADQRRVAAGSWSPRAALLREQTAMPQHHCARVGSPHSRTGLQPGSPPRRSSSCTRLCRCRRRCRSALASDGHSDRTKATPRIACSHRQGARCVPPRWRSSLRTCDRSSPRETYRQHGGRPPARRCDRQRPRPTDLSGRSPWRPARPLPASRRSGIGRSRVPRARPEGLHGREGR